MRTIKERMDEYIDSICSNCRECRHQCAVPALRKSFIAGAESEHAELTRWHDPKEVLPPIEKVVEVKLTFGRGYALAERGDDGWWYADSEEWEISDEQVIGWRYINE